ncbi:MAG: NAD(P)-dependent oxidoreductase [Pseudonocardiales bacterium]|nr:NAD(P)-dependent oxidoreductase [Pseudonocardiales bacterium]MBV9030375.1 NAD(P)-dependent oxidoreductase [Pseudonocardiales bacterium]
MNTSVIGILHPGHMGAAIAAQFVANGHTVLWCPDGRSAATAHRADQAGLHPVPLVEFLRQSRLVLSICSPAAAEDVATDVAHLEYNGIYVDANAISPVRMHRITARLTEAGAEVIDGCIFGAPPGGHPPARLYLAGPESARRRVADLLTGTLAEPVHLGEQLGQASAVKMAFACYQKASRALAALAHALADDLDVTEALLAEAERMPRDILANRDYLPSVASRAWRWAPEMREVADTLRAHQLPVDLALATAEVLQRWHDNSPVPTDSPTAALRRLHGSNHQER